MSNHPGYRIDYRLEGRWPDEPITRSHRCSPIGLSPVSPDKLPLPARPLAHRSAWTRLARGRSPRAPQPGGRRRLRSVEHYLGPSILATISGTASALCSLRCPCDRRCCPTSPPATLPGDEHHHNTRYSLPLVLSPSCCAKPCAQTLT